MNIYSGTFAGIYALQAGLHVYSLFPNCFNCMTVLRDVYLPALKRRGNRFYEPVRIMSTRSQHAQLPSCQARTLSLLHIFSMDFIPFILISREFFKPSQEIKLI